MTTEHDCFVTPENVNPICKNLHLSLTGPLVRRTFEIQDELNRGESKLFKDIIRTNVGDPQAMGQKPITFIRQTVAVCSYPHLLNDPNFPDDVKDRARDILKECHGTVGIYVFSQGMNVVRKQIAKYIEERDGIPANFEDICIDNGAGESIRTMLKFLSFSKDGKRSALLVPSPKFPMYSIYATEFNMKEVEYYLDEENDWALDIKELQRVVDEVKETAYPRVLIVTNPGNPTGQVLTRKNIEDIIKFAYNEKLIIFADEVYQQNIYEENCKFYSFKKVAFDLGPPYSKMELVSFMSVSKGYMGECGLRSGYSEFINLSSKVRNLYLLIVNSTFCANTLGQVALYATLNPPRPGEPSYELFIKEKNEILNNLKIKAAFIKEMLNSVEGFRCNPVQGAFYAFPRISLPPKAIEEAKKRNIQPDTLYCIELLERTGICVLPGSSFGQLPGTWHIRTTIMPPLDKLKDMVERLKEFQTYFYGKYK